MTIGRYASSSSGQRTVCLVLLAVMLVACAIDWSGWRVFGGYEAEVALSTGLAAAFYFAWLFETLERE